MKMALLDSKDRNTAFGGPNTCESMRHPSLQFVREISFIDDSFDQSMVTYAWKATIHRPIRLLVRFGFWQPWKQKLCSKRSKMKASLFHITLFSTLGVTSGNRSSLAFVGQCLTGKIASARTRTSTWMSSDWSGFSALDDDDDDLDMRIDTREYAKEEDSQEMKAQVGASLDPPSIENNAQPLFVPAGSQLELDEETVLAVLSACREEIGTLFGYSAENRGVGITGGVDFVEMDGPTVILRLKGRFWHQRTTVLERVSNYLQQRIPEIIDVIVEDEWQLTDEANEVF